MLALDIEWICLVSELLPIFASFLSEKNYTDDQYGGTLYQDKKNYATSIPTNRLNSRVQLEKLHIVWPVSAW